MSWIKVISINLLVLLGIILVVEGVLRLFIDSRSPGQYDWYSAPKEAEPGSINIHSYANIPINSKGFYDQEWESPKTKHRKAYFGDSVTYGVGAGYPYRITEYLDDFEEKIEHVNISGGLDASLLTLGTSDEIIQLVKNNEIDSIVYLMNLNDISPLAYSSMEAAESDVKFNLSPNISPENQVLLLTHYNVIVAVDKETSQNLLKIKSLIRTFDQIFGNSVLYTYLRLKIKNILVLILGYESTGYLSMELEPYKYSSEIELAAIKLAKKINILENKGIKFCTLLLPYEMQISEDAAEVYRNMGVTFEDGFLSFQTQNLFKTKFNEHSKSDIHILGSAFEEAKVGSFFVYNAGGQIDFNHPNRLGHLILAKEIYEQNLCLD